MYKCAFTTTIILTLLSQSTVLTWDFTTATSRLDYSNAFLYEALMSIMKNLHQVQNTATHLVLQCSKHSDLTVSL